MASGRNRLYITLAVACVTGYVWLFYNLLSKPSDNTEGVGLCFIKHATHIPCPSCGSTRSVLSLMEGDLVDALRINPLGIVIALILIIAPMWLALDLFTKRNSLFVYYQKAEELLKSPFIAAPLVLLVFANWVWNIMKGL
jgi:hypothetical protein